MVAVSVRLEHLGMQRLLTGASPYIKGFLSKGLYTVLYIQVLNTLQSEETLVGFLVKYKADDF